MLCKHVATLCSRTCQPLYLWVLIRILLRILPDTVLTASFPHTWQLLKEIKPNSYTWSKWWLEKIGLCGGSGGSRASEERGWLMDITRPMSSSVVRPRWKKPQAFKSERVWAWAFIRVPPIDCQEGQKAFLSQVRFCIDCIESQER